MAKIKDLTGKEFGFLKVIKFSENRKGVIYWECKCSCGNFKNVRGGHLKSGNTVSCGCKKKQYEDLVGKKFNRLTVESYSHKLDRQHFWNCSCECGSTPFKKVGGCCLRSGNTKSCGCLRRDVCIERSTIHGLAVGGRKGIYNPEYEKHLRKRPQHRIRKTASKMAWYGLKKNKSSKKGGSFWNYLPYAVDDLKEHLEQQFEDWMTWDNYGSDWSIDHIKPQSSFSYTSMSDDQFQECWTLDNLRPLSVVENMKKGSKLID